MVDEYATDVGELISALQKLRPEQKVIGESCRALLHIVEQESGGSVLVMQASARPPTPAPASAA